MAVSCTRLPSSFGLRLDLRYLHALVDESARTGGYFKDYAFWRVSVGFTIGFPRQ